MVFREICLAQDTSNWLAILRKEAEEAIVSQAIQRINSIEEETKKQLKGKNILLKSVLDELKHVMRTKLGTIIKTIEQEIISIIRIKNISEREKISLIEKLMWEDIRHSFDEKHWSLYIHIREYVWGVKNRVEMYHFTLKFLMKRDSRANVYANAKEHVMNRVELAYLDFLCGRNLVVYDATEKIDALVKAKDEVVEKVIALLRGSRSRGSNLYDKLHLLSCVTISDEWTRSALLFSTKDETILKNSLKNNPFSFHIVPLIKTPEVIVQTTKALMKQTS